MWSNFGRALALVLAVSESAFRAPYDANAPTPIPPAPVEDSMDLDVAEARVEYIEALDLLVFEQELKGTAGGTSPRRRGSLNGAAVVAYLFPTTLSPGEVGFESVQGTVALAVTSHPDFDDTPLWDENGNRKTDDDGAAWHAHWLVLEPDPRLEGDLVVKELGNASPGAALPPTGPETALYLDSPGFPVLASGGSLKVIVPAQRVRGNTNFTYDATTAYLQMSDIPGTPVLGVYKVYDSLSGGKKMPFKVTRR